MAGLAMTGTHVQVPPACSSGVADMANRCCDSGVVDLAGGCCPAGALLDAVGACCPAGKALDAMGTCGGSAQLLDVQGAGCESGVVDAQGACCQVTINPMGPEHADRARFKSNLPTLCMTVPFTLASNCGVP